MVVIMKLDQDIFLEERQLSIILPREYSVPKFCKEDYYDDLFSSGFWVDLNCDSFVLNKYNNKNYKRIEIPFKFYNEELYETDTGLTRESETVLYKFLKFIENFKVRNYINRNDIIITDTFTVPINTVLPDYIDNMLKVDYIINISNVYYEGIEFNTTHSYDEVISDIMKLNKDNTSFTIYYSPND